MKRANKFGAIRQTVDGISFDSQKEARHFSELRLRVRAGEIRDLVAHPRFPLHVGEFLIGHYVADASYTDAKTGEKVVVDVKGGKATQTDLFIWKAKHLKAEYGITVSIV